MVEGAFGFSTLRVFAVGGEGQAIVRDRARLDAPAGREEGGAGLGLQDEAWVLWGVRQHARACDDALPGAAFRRVDGPHAYPGEAGEDQAHPAGEAVRQPYPGGQDVDALVSERRRVATENRAVIDGAVADEDMADDGGCVADGRDGRLGLRRRGRRAIPAEAGQGLVRREAALIGGLCVQDIP